METQVVDRAARTLNMSELAHVLGMSLPTLRGYLQKYPDFPVERRGDKGDPYAFDFDAVRVWLDRHDAGKKEAEEARREQLELLGAEIYGASPAAAEGKVLTPAERKTLAEAVRAEDYNRVKRGELLERREIAYQLRQAFAKMQKGLRRIPHDFARETGIERGARLALENLIRQRTNEMIEALLPLLEGDGADAERDSA